MEAARTSKTSVDNYFTWQYIPEDKSELHTHRHENLKSHKKVDIKKRLKNSTNHSGRNSDIPEELEKTHRKDAS
jgi:hypothetical protein